MKHVIEIKDSSNNFAIIGAAELTPRQHHGWQSVQYKGKRYQVFGGIQIGFQSSPGSVRSLPTGDSGQR